MRCSHLRQTGYILFYNVIEKGHHLKNHIYGILQVEHGISSPAAPRGLLTDWPPGWQLLHGPWTCAWSGALPLESAGLAFSGYSTKWQPHDISQLLWLTLSLQSEDLEKLEYCNQSLSNSNFALAKTLRWHKTTLAYTPNWMGADSLRLLPSPSQAYKPDGI